MELLVNDRSLHGQFPDSQAFRDAVQQLMAIRKLAKRFGRELYCHRNLLQAPVTPTLSLPQAIQALNIDERRAFMQWLTQYGPFWEDIRQHGPDDWLEHHSDIVTDSAVGEAAWCCLHGIERGLISLAPSSWQFSPVRVVWKIGDIISKTVEVINHWHPDTVEAFLQQTAAPLQSWEQLETRTKTWCDQLIFAADAFTPLTGHPFAPGAAERLCVILNILNQFKSCFDTSGQRTAEGHQLYHDFFTGKKEDGGRGLLFSDSSDQEKSKFASELAFRHPDDPGKTLFCPWHGKVQTPQLRIHFSWPIRADEPFYIVYIGPKITRA